MARNGESPTGISRRSVLRRVGTAGLGTAGLAVSSGTAAAGDTPDQLYFCGCSQVVVTGLNEHTSITVYLRATQDGGCHPVEVTEPDCEVGGRDPNLNYAYRYTYEEGEAILAVGTSDGNVWCNPNNCARKWQDSLSCFAEIRGTLRDACTDFEALDAPGDVYTNKCGTVCNDGGPNGGPERDPGPFPPGNGRQSPASLMR